MSGESLDERHVAILNLDFVFIGSTIEEIVFENTHVHATDLSLVGVYADRIHIIDTRWNARKVMVIRRIPGQRVSELLIQNTVLNRLVLALLYNYTNILLNRCKITHLQPAPSVVPQNITSISFTQSVLAHWFVFLDPSAASFNLGIHML